MLTKFIVGVGLVSQLGLLGTAHATSADLCTDAVKATCQNVNSDNQAKLAREVATRAVQATERFFNLPVTSAEQFMDTITTNLILKASNRPALDAEVRKAVTYISCLDFISRSYFSAQNETNYSRAICFPDGGHFTTVSDLNARLERLGDLSLNQAALETFNDVKAISLRVIDESNYSPEVKPRVRKQLADTAYFSIKEFAMESLAEVDEDSKTAGAQGSQRSQYYATGAYQIITQCDPLGASENAFNYATTLKGADGKMVRANRMVICPSMWVYGTATRNETAMASAVYDPNRPARDATYVRPPTVIFEYLSGMPEMIAPVVMHELGHSVDGTLRDWLDTIVLNEPGAESMSSSFKEGVKSTVGAFTSCIANRHFKTGTLSLKGDAAPLTVTFPDSVKALYYFSEYHADTVSANGMSLYLSRFRSLAEKQQVIEKGLKLFCGSKKHDPFNSLRQIHPSGEFRIRTTFLGNANLRKALGCTTAAPETSCSFR